MWAKLALAQSRGKMPKIQQKTNQIEHIKKSTTRLSQKFVRFFEVREVLMICCGFDIIKKLRS
jgi:hypothetical protein